MNAPLNQTTQTTLTAREKWQGFHWTFFIDVQGMILSLLCFERAWKKRDYSRAETELRCTASLLKASGAAMRLAGSFSADEYEDDVRVSMTPPLLDMDNFSGLMSWEHARLVRLWQKLAPTFGSIEQHHKQELGSAHRTFVDAYIDMIGSHRAVCSRFVGDKESLRSCNPAVSVLEKLLTNRLRLIDPNGTATCPFSGNPKSTGAPQEGTREDNKDQEEACE